MLIVACYDDCFFPELVEAALETIAQYEDWELAAFIGAEAVYAENFLSLN